MMPFDFEPLWTDWLIYILLGVVGGFARYSSRHEPMRRPWRIVRTNAWAMGSIVVLAAYVAIGLMDSVHFRLPAGNGSCRGQEVQSLLDLAADTLCRQTEQTYSAPFATHGYTFETVTGPEGVKRREPVRLRYGGAHLGDPAGRGADIASGLAKAALATLVMMSAVVWWGAHRRRDRSSADVRRRTVLITMGLLGFLIWTGVLLGGQYHLLGTDQVGHDVLFKSLKSIRTGLVIGTLTTLFMLPFAVVLGLLAGYFRGWVDELIQYVYTTLSSIPDVLLIASAVLIMQAWMAANPESFDSAVVRADLRLLFLCLIMGITGWTGLCRLLRAETLKLRELEFVQAAVALGARRRHILAHHILPNVLHLVLITVVLEFSGLVLAEAVLSYVGVGVDPGTESFGNMINGARLEMAREPMVWWTLAAALAFMFVLVLAANLLADAVREAFDPRARRDA